MILKTSNCIILLFDDIIQSFAADPGIKKINVDNKLYLTFLYIIVNHLVKLLREYLGSKFR